METFSYDLIPKEEVSCAICSGRSFFILSKLSKNKLDVRTVMCKKCGLIFITPRMTAKSYDNYYKYFYRKDRSEITGTKKDIEKNFYGALKFGRALGLLFKSFLRPGLTIDVGSSTGGVLAGLKEVESDLNIFGVEPSLEEAEYANAHGVKTTRAIFEDFVRNDNVPPSASNIFCVQSLNHLLAPHEFLEWAYLKLENGGHIFLVVKNFLHQVRRAGSIEAGVQIDHPYMFTPESLKLLVESRGFRVVYLDVDEGKSKDEIEKQRLSGLNKHHIRLVAEKVSCGTKTKSGAPFRGFLRRIQFSLPLIKLWYFIRYSRFRIFR